MTDSTAYMGAAIFDGTTLFQDHALVVEGARIAALVPVAEVPADARRQRLGGGTLVPGFVDLQVNGGGGIQLNADPSVEALKTIAAAHLTLGTTALLPTLITDTPDKTRAVIDAVAQAVEEGVPGIAGLHLEGPHLSIARKGAHDPALIRPMEAEDLALLIEAAGRLPALMVTVAPENVTVEQVRALADAGVVVSLGHSDAPFQTCVEYAAAGARVATHLFNAMSQLGSRAPGLVGAALQTGGLSAGLIADGVHVDPATIAIALRAKRGPGGIFLVTDAMAPAGTEMESFTLEGRTIRRENGRLTLEDGTLAGADLELASAIRLMVEQVGLDLTEALTMATSRPAGLMGLAHGALKPGRAADFVALNDKLEISAIWKDGRHVTR